MIIVADTSPINYLALIKEIEVLPTKNHSKNAGFSTDILLTY